MKFTNLLSLLILSTPSTMALRGASQHRAQEDATQRALGGSNYSYEEHKGACRVKSDGTGAGSHGDEFYRYEWKHNNDVSYDWCEEKCSDKGRDCKGFEYYDHGEDSHCETWKHKIGGYDEDRDDHYCYIKEYDGGDDDDDDDDDGNDEYDKDIYDHLKGACRKRSHPRNGIKNEDYRRFGSKSFRWCEKECTEDHDCSGFEYKNKHGKKHCELWSTHIDGYERSDYFDCYVKKD